MNRPRLKKPRLLEMPLSRLFPNMVTLAGLCCGLSAMRFAFEQKFELAVALIVVAAIIDGMDGRIARFLNSTSLFGAQLDSLSDFVCFGVAPAIVMYMWALHEIHGLGWALVLFFSVCCALRLARFNTSLTEEAPAPWKAIFFTGMPSPAGAMISMMPLAISFYAPDTIFDNALLSAAWVAFIAVLMPSRVPMFAAKKIRVRHELVLPIMLGCAVVIVLLLIEPWMTLTGCGVAYLATIPFSARRYRKLAAAAEAASPGEAS